MNPNPSHLTPVPDTEKLAEFNQLLKASDPKAHAQDAVEQARAMGIVPPIPGTPIAAPEPEPPMVLRPGPRPASYRHMGKARKRELAANRRVAGDILTQQRERAQEARRADRAARA